MTQVIQLTQGDIRNLRAKKRLHAQTDPDNVPVEIVLLSKKEEVALDREFAKSSGIGRDGNY